VVGVSWRCIAASLRRFGGGVKECEFSGCVASLLSIVALSRFWCMSRLAPLATPRDRSHEAPPPHGRPSV
jgi:hypothetical protein